MHIGLMRVTLGMLLVPPSIATLIKYYVLGLGEASFSELPLMYAFRDTFPLSSNFTFHTFSRFISRWPVNEKTPHGFLCQIFFQSIECFTLMSLMLSALTFLIGSCWFLNSTVDDMKCDLNGCTNSTNVKQQLQDAVKVFSVVKKLSA